MVAKTYFLVSKKEKSGYSAALMQLKIFVPTATVHYERSKIESWDVLKDGRAFYNSSKLTNNKVCPTEKVVFNSGED